VNIILRDGVFKIDDAVEERHSRGVWPCNDTVLCELADVNACW
jgi:hypothetical protein